MRHILALFLCLFSDGLVPGVESVQFSHPGHVGATRTITIDGRETKLDVQLSAQP